MDKTLRDFLTDAEEQFYSQTPAGKHTHLNQARRTPVK